MSNTPKRHVLMGDSVTGDTRVIIDGGIEVPIESLFVGPTGDGKEYCTSTHQVLTYDMDTGKTVYRPIKYVMRHYTDKPVYRVLLNNSSWIDVTEDHSLMGYVDAQHRREDEPAIIEVKPQDIGGRVKSLIQLKRIPYAPEATRYHSTVSPCNKAVSIGDDVSLYTPMGVERLPYSNQYVYDIEVDDTHTFFANGVLVHNTDSAYLRLDLYAKQHGITLTKEVAVELADRLQVKLQDDLPILLADKFLTTPENMRILEPGREVVGRRGLFKNKKKRYAIHVVDNEGKDSDKLKIMGMETQRSDTPKYIQEFLTKCLTAVVKHDATYTEIEEMVNEFRETFKNMPSWQKGSPGRVKNLSTNTSKYKVWEKTGTHIGSKKPLIHITVKAAMNTNKLMDFHDERRWDKIQDGDKVEVIYLTDNPEQMDCVAIKVGETYIPEWFKDLPFDNQRMEEKLLDKKLFNVVGDVMEWDFTPPKSFADEITKVVDDFYD